MSFFELAKERFSVRNFSDKAIEEEKLNQIIQAGRVAPTAKNKQPQKIYVLQSKEAIEKVKTLSPCIYDAPTVLLICYDESAVWYNSRRPGYNSGEMDATIVCTHMMFATGGGTLASATTRKVMRREHSAWAASRTKSMMVSLSRASRVLISSG